MKFSSWVLWGLVLGCGAIFAACVQSEDVEVEVPEDALEATPMTEDNQARFEFD